MSRVHIYGSNHRRRMYGDSYLCHHQDSILLNTYSCFTYLLFGRETVLFLTGKKTVRMGNKFSGRRKTTSAITGTLIFEHDLKTSVINKYHAQLFTLMY